MKIGVYLTGPFGQTQNLYKSRNEMKRGRSSINDVSRQILCDTKQVILLQKEANLDFIIDPMFNFFYLFQPFVENFPGVEDGSQENWFNNNVFYRRPKFKSLLTEKKGFTEKYFHLELLAKENAMVVLPSPYTLFALSDFTEHKERNNKEIILENLAYILKSEAENLAEKGIKRIQYDEPVIAVKNSLNSITSEDLKLLEKGMNICGRINKATTSLHTYFGDAGKIIPYLINLNVDCVGIDCIETNLDSVLKNKFHNKELAIGLLDSRSTFLEDPRELANKLEKIAESCQPSYLWLTPNTATEYRGYTNAVNKIKILEEVRRILNE